jgi:hypothetical protein
MTMTMTTRPLRRLRLPVPRARNEEDDVQQGVKAAGKVELLAPSKVINSPSNDAREPYSYKRLWTQLFGGSNRQVVPAQACEGGVSETLEHPWSEEDESQNTAVRTR